MMKFEDESSEISIVFTQFVLQHFENNRQTNHNAFEAGGQIFARFEGNVTLVEAATGPRPTDQRSRFYYRPDREAEQREIRHMFSRGLHYVGDWHTHPSESPRPSADDIKSIRSLAIQSKHELMGVLLVVIGTNPFFEGGLWVSLENGITGRILRPTE